MDDFKAGLAIGVAVMFIAMMITIGILFSDVKTHEAIIENNCGYYDPMTREFKWGALK